MLLPKSSGSQDLLHGMRDISTFKLDDNDADPFLFNYPIGCFLMHAEAAINLADLVPTLFGIEKRRLPLIFFRI